MADEKFLTTDEVAKRYRGEVSVGTLENWRAQRIGPAFVKVGKAVLYPIEELDAWDQRNLVACDDARVVGRRRRRSEVPPPPPRALR
ncbi:AlpA family transcriptional regulator [Caulobacter sp. UNC358MFTsu5.1]|uniref:helix-turn-helix transcriptional regulator n=1 Tax=Caulobacter sp. UNC358MFTsu5.1 TaxID=1449049 RepID=UPI0004A779BD|nr:helix-turn-helix domain-containing protein [Caulobacter sp. UNC358MFTsu5.1]